MRMASIKLEKFTIIFALLNADFTAAWAIKHLSKIAIAFTKSDSFSHLIADLEKIDNGPAAFAVALRDKQHIDIVVTMHAIPLFYRRICFAQRQTEMAFIYDIKRPPAIFIAPFILIILNMCERPIRPRRCTANINFSAKNVLYLRFRLYTLGFSPYLNQIFTAGHNSLKNINIKRQIGNDFPARLNGRQNMIGDGFIAFAATRSSQQQIDHLASQACKRNQLQNQPNPNRSHDNCRCLTYTYKTHYV